MSNAPPMRVPRRPAPGSSLARRTWQVSFCDLLTVLLTFFVMLHAMSKPAPNSWHKIASALSQGGIPAPSGQDKAAPAATAVFNAATTTRVTASTSLDYLQPLLEARIQAAGNDLNGVTLQRRDDALCITWPSAQPLLGSDGTLSATNERGVAALAEMLARIGNQVMVIGESNQAPSDVTSWVQAVNNAALVVNALHHAGYDRGVAVMGRMARPNFSPSVEIMVMSYAQG